MSIYLFFFKFQVLYSLCAGNLHAPAVLIPSICTQTNARAHTGEWGFKGWSPIHFKHAAYGVSSKH